MLCPNCDAELKISERQGVEIDYCPQCRGIWLDRGELDKIIDRSALAIATPQQSYQPKRKPKKHHYNDDYHYDNYQYRRKKKKKRKSLLEEIFDFD